MHGKGVLLCCGTAAVSEHWESEKKQQGENQIQKKSTLIVQGAQQSKQQLTAVSLCEYYYDEETNHCLQSLLFYNMII